MNHEDRILRTLLLVVGLFTLTAPWWPGAEAGALEMPAAKEPPREVGYGQVAFRGKGPEAWHWETVKARRELRQLRRTLRHRSSSLEAIALASTAYGVDYWTLRRKAACESRFNPQARNPQSTASGLFQFLTSTWASTPYRRLSIWSPYASALAAGWMHDVGRGGEWVCR